MFKQDLHALMPVTGADLALKNVGFLRAHHYAPYIETLPAKKARTKTKSGTPFRSVVCRPQVAEVRASGCASLGRPPSLIGARDSASGGSRRASSTEALVMWSPGAIAKSDFKMTTGYFGPKKMTITEVTGRRDPSEMCLPSRPAVWPGQRRGSSRRSRRVNSRRRLTQGSAAAAVSG